jgi:hypothetical protein
MARKINKGNKLLWDNLKFELDWNFNRYIIVPFRQFIQGIKNLWTWKSIIWNDRWYDYDFFHKILRKKLETMYKGYENAYACGSEELQTEIKVLIDILDMIDELEDSFEEDADKKIDELYQTFGEKLFSIREFENKDCEGKVIRKYKTTLFRRLWD